MIVPTAPAREGMRIAEYAGPILGGAVRDIVSVDLDYEVLGGIAAACSRCRRTARRRWWSRRAPLDTALRSCSG